MIDMAVRAMANPMSAFLTKALGISLWTGEAGYSSKAVKTHAEIMKIPSSAPSIKYSGQCRASAWPALRASDAQFLRVGRDALRLRCAAGAGEMCVPVTRDRIRIGAISDKHQKGKLGRARGHPDWKIHENSCDFLEVATSDRHSRVLFCVVHRNHSGHRTVQEYGNLQGNSQIPYYVLVKAEIRVDGDSQAKL